MSSLYERVATRRSYSKVTDDAPSTEELLSFVAAAGRIADHGALHPWRLIALRGAARERLGRAFAQASGDKKEFSTKPFRAPLLIAIIVSYREDSSVPRWEQQAVASGVAHVVSLLLYDAGWGVMWRTGKYTRTKPVAKMHNLQGNEELLGWLYVGGIPDTIRSGPRSDHRTKIDPKEFLISMDR